MKKYKVLSIMPLMLFFALFSYSHAATYYVSPSGSATWSSCTNINTPCSWQTAMTNAVADDIVYFRGGTYSVESSCKNSWELIAMAPANSGSPGHYITFAAYPGETPIVTPCTADRKSPAFGARDVNYIIWDGFTGTTLANASSSDEGWYFLYWNSTGSIVRNMNFSGTYRTSYHNNAPIRIESSTGNEVYNNYLHDITGDSSAVNTSGVWLFYANSVKVYNNTFYNCRNGIQQKDGPNINNEFFNNFMYSIAGNGIMLNEQMPGGSGNKVYRNVLVNVTGVPIYVYPSGSTSETQTDYQVYNNTIYGTTSGISVSNSARNNQIWNNIIYGASDPFLRYYTGDSIPSYSDYNLFYSTGSQRWNLNYTTDYTSLTNWRTATSFDTHSITSNPLFVNAGGNKPEDYMLSSGSPARNVGRYGGDLGAFTKEYGTVIGYRTPQRPLSPKLK